MSTRTMRRFPAVLLVIAVAAGAAGACKKKPPVVSVPPPTPTAFPSANTNNTPPPPVSPGPPPATAPVPSDTIAATSLLPWESQPLDVINGPDSPLKPVFFGYDSDELDEPARKILDGTADLLKSYKTWVITVEGHCDERGTPEYNLALGDRRALAAKNYLMSLGIGGDRIRTVSYGSEFPFDPGHAEGAWAKNRRAHFMLTSK